MIFAGRSLREILTLNLEKFKSESIGKCQGVLN